MSLRARSISEYSRATVFLTCAVMLLTFIILSKGWTFASTGVVISALGLALGQIITSFDAEKPHVLSIISLVTISHVLLFIFRPAYSIIFQESRNLFSGERYSEEFVFACLVAAIGYIAICSGYRQRNGAQNKAAQLRSVRPLPVAEWRVLAPILWFVVILGFGLYFIYILQIGPSNWWNAISAGRSEASSDNFENHSAYFYSANAFAYGALIFMALQAGLSRHYRHLVGLVALLALAALPSFALGSRSVFVPLFVALIYTLYLIYPKLMKFGNVVLWGPAAFILLIIAPRLWRNNDSVQGGLASSLHQALSFEAIVADFLGGFDTAMVDALSLQVQAHLDDNLEYTFGFSYFYLLAGAIPRAIWPNKPMPVDTFLNSVLFPQTHSKGIGFSFSIYSEAFLALGFVGVIVFCFIIGNCLARIAAKCLAKGTVPYVFILIMVTSYIFPVMRGSVSFDIQRLLIPLIPALVALWLGRFLLATGYRRYMVSGASQNTMSKGV